MGDSTYRSDYSGSQCNILFKSWEVNSNLSASARLYDISGTPAYNARVIDTAPPRFCGFTMSKSLCKHRFFGAVFGL